LVFVLNVPENRYLLKLLDMVISKPDTSLKCPTKIARDKFYEIIVIISTTLLA